MMRNTNGGCEPPLTANRAFVVQFSTDTQLAGGRLNARVEHVVSGEASYFSSLPERLKFLDRVLNKVPGLGTPRYVVDDYLSESNATLIGGRTTGSIDKRSLQGQIDTMLEDFDVDPLLKGWTKILDWSLDSDISCAIVSESSTGRTQKKALFLSSSRQSDAYHFLTFNTLAAIKNGGTYRLDCIVPPNNAIVAYGYDAAESGESQGRKSSDHR